MTAQHQEQWFFSSGGERFGPVGFDELLEMAREGKLDPRNDLVWSAGFDDWEPAGHVEGLFERRAVRKEGESMEGGDAFARTGTYEPVPIPKAVFPGTGRIGYLMGMAVMPAALVTGWYFVIPFLKPEVPEAYAVYLPLVAPPLALLMALATQVKRFRNLGMSGWWLFGLLVPVLNLWLGFRSLACPAGYAKQRKLDVPGRLVAVLYWVVILGGAGVAVATGVGAFGEMKESGMIGDLIKQVEELRQAVLSER